MFPRTVVAGLIMAVSASASAQSVDVSLSDDTAKFTYSQAVGKQGFGRGAWDASVLFNDDDDFFGSLGVHVMGEAGSGAPGLDAGVGLKFYGMSAGDYEAAAVAISGLLHFAPPAAPRFHFRGYANFAPSVVTFMDGDDFTEIGIDLGYEIVRDAVFYVGYRRVTLDLDIDKQKPKDVKLDRGAHVGIRFSF